MSPSCSGSKDKPSKKPAYSKQIHLLLDAGFLLGLFYLEDGGDMFLRNVG
jgi:hypothetical protein